jgi:hypothetical protein
VKGELLVNYEPDECFEDTLGRFMPLIGLEIVHIS